MLNILGLVSLALSPLPFAPQDAPDADQLVPVRWVGSWSNGRREADGEASAQSYSRFDDSGAFIARCTVIRSVYKSRSQAASNLWITGKQPDGTDARLHNGQNLEAFLDKNIAEQRQKGFVPIDSFFQVFADVHAIGVLAQKRDSKQVVFWAIQAYQVFVGNGFAVTVQKTCTSRINYHEGNAAKLAYGKQDFLRTWGDVDIFPAWLRAE